MPILANTGTPVPRGSARGGGGSVGSMGSGVTVGGALVACGGCGKDGARLQCSRCKVVRYCDPACQKTHWKAGGHKAACVPA
jgi:hypothetical protein